MGDSAARVLRIEAEALVAAADRVDDAAYDFANKLLADAPGPIVTTGVGVSGTIARKLAGTLTSTGTPAMFLHPSDALHGQLGLLRRGDVVVALSNSGETEELLAVLPFFRSRDIQVVAIVGNTDSTLARNAAAVLDARADTEACLLQLAPTSSTTLALAVGDALAVGLMGFKGFTSEDFARNHPSGRLGRRLTLSVSDLMQTRVDVGSVGPTASLLDVVTLISGNGVGAALVTEGEVLVGLVTDGDVRRGIAQLGEGSIASARACDLMTQAPEVVRPDIPAHEALLLMEQRSSQISVLPVVEDGRVLGLLRLHDLVRAGL